MNFQFLIIGFFICASSSVCFGYLSEHEPPLYENLTSTKLLGYPRIVGGSNAFDGEYPFQVSLRPSWYIHIGSGTILNNEWVVTAARYVWWTRPEDWTVIAGTNDLHSGGTHYKVLEIHYHENYNDRTGEHDVALLKVEPVTYTDKIQPIVVDAEHVKAKETLTVSGWGVLVEQPKSDILQHTNVVSITNEYCKSTKPYKPVFESTICTVPEVEEGPCHGDYGGPLIRTVNGERRLVGIVTWRRPCNRYTPTVFTRISPYIEWLNNICNCL